MTPRLYDPTASGELETLHGIDDPAKLEALTDDMIANGWRGAPLVRWGDGLVTGTHRYHAANAAEICIPVVDLEDLFEEAGLDFAALWAANGEPTYGEDGMVWLINGLPEAVRDEYGIDIH